MDDTRFVQEIRMQPAALRNVTDYYAGNEGALLLSECTDLILSKRKLVFTGMGTSLYAPYLILKELDGIVHSIEIRDAGELLHFGLHGLHDDSVLVAVSQSGESAETKKVVETMSGKVPIISIVNNTESFIGRNADILLPLHAGEEVSISTKSYSNTLAVLLLLSSHIRNDTMSYVFKSLLDTAGVMEQTLDETHVLAKQTAEFFDGINNLHIVSRGTDLVTARQCALILKEGAGLFSEALSAGLFRHGPIELSGYGHAVMFFVSQGNKPKLTTQLALETNESGSKVLLVSDIKGKSNKQSSTFMVTHIDCRLSRYFSLSCAPFIEFFVYEAAKLIGKEAGIFNHATKITSRE
ncbi:SIS domain-containing protein [Candidatus Omnitrophota bacterium]